MYFDTHTHLDDDKFNEDREAVIAKVRESGVELAVNVGSGIEESESCIALAEKYDFRRAYCKLNVVYRKPIGVAVKILYPFRGVISKLKKYSLMKKIDAILLMESICREQR